MTAIESIPGIGPYIPYLTLAMAAASILAACMPPPILPPAGAPSSAIYVTIYNLVHLAAANVFNAKAAASATQDKPK